MRKVFLDEYVLQVWKLYLEQAEEAVKDGAISNKMKELIAMGVAITAHCEPCVKIPARRSIKAGANAREIAEVEAVVVMLCGGKKVGISFLYIAANSSPFSLTTTH